MVKSAVAILSLRIQPTDTNTPCNYLEHFFSIPEGNLLTTLERTFTAAEVSASQINLSVFDGLLLNFNAVGPAVNTTLTFDMLSVGQNVTKSTLAAESKANPKFYPNPSSDRVNFESVLTSKADVNVSLCDMVGRERSSYNNGNSPGSFDVR